MISASAGFKRLLQSVGELGSFLLNRKWESGQLGLAMSRDRGRPSGEKQDGIKLMVHFHAKRWGQEIEGAGPFDCQSGGHALVLAVTLDLVFMMFWELLGMEKK